MWLTIDKLFSYSVGIFYLIGMLIILLLVLILLFKKILSHQRLKLLVIFRAFMLKASGSCASLNQSLCNIDGFPRELIGTKKIFENYLRNKCCKCTEAEEKIKHLSSVARVAYHDFQSPIAVMTMSLKLMEQSISQAEVILLQKAIQRMRDIGSVLLACHAN